MAKYVTEQEIAQRLANLSPTSETWSIMISAIDAAEAAVEDYCGDRVFTVPTGAATARVFIPRGGHVYTDDIGDLTGLVVADTSQTYGSTAYQLEPLNALAKGRPYDTIRLLGGLYASTCYGQATVTVTAPWGWPVTPEPVKEATRTLAGDLYHLKDNQFGVAGFGEMGVLMVRENSYVKSLLKNYRRAFAMR